MLILKLGNTTGWACFYNDSGPWDGGEFTLPGNDLKRKLAEFAHRFYSLERDIRTYVILQHSRPTKLHHSLYDIFEPMCKGLGADVVWLPVRHAKLQAQGVMTTERDMLYWARKRWMNPNIKSVAESFCLLTRLAILDHRRDRRPDTFDLVNPICDGCGEPCGKRFMVLDHCCACLPCLDKHHRHQNGMSRGRLLETEATVTMRGEKGSR